MISTKSKLRLKDLSRLKQRFSYASYSIENYSAIVQNEKYLFDLKIKNLTVEFNKSELHRLE